jgi:hypothetical protein
MDIVPDWFKVDGAGRVGGFGYQQGWAGSDGDDGGDHGLHLSAVGFS